MATILRLYSQTFTFVNAITIHIIELVLYAISLLQSSILFNNNNNNNNQYQEILVTDISERNSYQLSVLGCCWQFAGHQPPVGICCRSYSMLLRAPCPTHFILLAEKLGSSRSNYAPESSQQKTTSILDCQHPHYMLLA